MATLRALLLFESFLKQHDQAAWSRTIEALLPGIHEVDRNAAQIWFHFFPLALAEAIAEIPDRVQLEQTLRLAGNYRVAEQRDTSHWFLYGHRYWPQVKAAIIMRTDSGTAVSSLELAAVTRDIAKGAAAAAGIDSSLVLGITAIGLMTLQQIGPEAFRAPSNAGDRSPRVLQKTPAQILASRMKTDKQGIAGLWRGIKAQYTVTFDERHDKARFTVIKQQHLTTASASDTREHALGPRTCVEGPIPVECRTASCGTCWVGVLGGVDRLSEVEPLEARRMKEFGYVNTREPKPLIRLACSAMAAGNVTIVIPPWNGFIGKRTGSRGTQAARQD